MAAVLTAENIPVVLKTINGLLATFKMSQVRPLEDFQNLVEETSQGPFHTVYQLDGEYISARGALQDLEEENIICVKRCCNSLTGWFPSGIITVVTWTLAGTATRHGVYSITYD